jgi:hypothetical protein
MKNLPKRKGLAFDMKELGKGDIVEFTFGTEKLLGIHGIYKIEVIYSSNMIFVRRQDGNETVEVRQTKDGSFFHIKSTYYEFRKTIPWRIKFIFIKEEDE